MLISFFSSSTTSISNKWILIQSAIAQKTSWLNQFLLNKQEHVDLSSLKLIDMTLDINIINNNY